MEDNRKRNMERRRETSRYAARDRRGKEADIFQDLKEVVPIVEEGTVTHLDRIALLRVAATVCRLRKTAGNVLENDLGKETIDIWDEDMLSECMDGFVIIADSDSSILYITESVALYLGLTQTDLTGRALKEFFHPDDYDEFVKLVGELCIPQERKSTVGTQVVFRMKTVISPRGRCLNLKSALYKPVSFLVHAKASTGGHVLLMQGTTVPAGQGSINATASALTKYTDTPTGTFMTRHTCDMRISYVSDRFNYILRSELKSLMGSSYYDLVHPGDVNIVAKAMKELFAKGHVRTPYYRLIAANRTLAWVQTEATTISHTTKGQKGQYVICVHFVLGIQAETESLVVCTDAVPAGMQVHIKKEIDDSKDYIGRQPEIIECVDFTPLIGADEVFDVETLRPPPEPVQPAADMGARKNSFDDVLQWLFRDQPSSPAPGFRRGDNMQRQEQAPRDDPSLASAQFMDSSPGVPSSDERSSSAGSSNRQFLGQGMQTYSPLAEGFSQCGLNSPPSIGTAAGGNGNPRPLSGGCTANQTRCVPAIQTSDPLTMPINHMGSGERPTTDMFAPMSTADPALTAQGVTFTQEPLIICDDLQWEEPDLSGLAPFVDNDEMVQIGDGLSPELQSLFDLPDWQPAQPLPPAAKSVPVERCSASPPPKRAPCNDYYGNPMYGRMTDYGMPPPQNNYWAPQPPPPMDYWHQMPTGPMRGPNQPNGIHPVYPPYSSLRS